MDITDSTDSSDASGDTGALRTEGGASIAKKVYVGTDADIDGTLEADAITVDGTTLAEYIADTVGAMVTSNTESGITVAYQDADNTLDFTIGTLNQDTTGTAAIATTVTITDNESTNENNAVIFTAGGDVDGGNLGLESDGNLTYNPSSGTLTATAFSGALTGNVTGTADVATVATTVTITDNESTDEDNAIIFTAGGDVDGGNIGLESDGNLTYNPSTGRLTATQLAGTLQTASQTNITAVGTIATGVWQGTAIASAYLDSDTAHLSGTQTFSGAKTFSADATFSGDTNTFSSANATDPLIIIKNTTNDTDGARLRFVKDKGAAGADNDVSGLIEFYADDANQDNILFAKITAQVAEADNGAEGGKLSLGVATHDGEFQNGLVLADGNAEDEIDVTIGNGTSSVTTIAGTLTMGSTAALTNAGLVAVANQSSITGLGTISSGTWAATDVAVAHGGTGASTLTANGVLIGNGTSAVTAVDLSTKGKILIGDGSGNPQALSIGSNDQVLTADSSEATGVKWADASGGGGITVTAGQKFKAGAPLVLSRYSLKAEAAHLHPYYHVEHQTTEASSPCQALGKTLSDGKRIGVIGYTSGASCKVRPFTIDPFVNIDSAAHVTWGTETEIYNNYTGTCLSISYDETANRFLYAYSHGDSGSSGYRKAHTRVVQIDDDMSVTLGSEQEISTNTVYNGNDGSPALCYIGGTINRHVIMYGNNSSDSTSYGFYRVLTLTGSSTNSVALGTEATFSGNERGYNIMLSPDTVTSSGNSGKFMMVFFSDEDGSNKHKAVIGTVTGGSTNTIAFGTEVNYYTGTQNYPGYDGAQLAFNTDRSMWAVMFDKGVQTEGDTSAGERNTVWIVSLEVSGTTITVDTANELRIDNGNSAGGSLRGMFLMYHQGQQCYYAGGFDSTNSYNFTGGTVEQAADGSFSMGTFTTNSSYQAVSEPGTGANSDSAYLYDKGSGTLVLHWQQTSSSDGYLTLMNFTGWNASNSASIRANGVLPSTNFVGIAAADADYGDSVEITTYGAVASSINSIYGLTAAMSSYEIYVQNDGNYNTSSGNVQVGVGLSSSSILLRPDII